MHEDLCNEHRARDGGLLTPPHQKKKKKKPDQSLKNAELVSINIRWVDMAAV